MCAYNLESYLGNNFRDLVFKVKLYTWLWGANWFKAFPRDFHPFTPGLEAKFAIEEAKK